MSTKIEDCQKEEEEKKAADKNANKHDEDFAPSVSEGLVKRIAEEIYGLKVVEWQQFDGYYDRNYHIRVLPTSFNSHLTSVDPDGYVMKISNTIDTRRPEIFDAQLKFMKHLRSHGIPTQEPVPSLSGQYVDFYQFPVTDNTDGYRTHAVSLRTFLPGRTVTDVTLTRDLCFKLGKLQGIITNALKDFSHPFYDTFECVWSLDNIPKLKEFVHVITDVRDRRVVDDVIAQFTTTVLTRRKELRSGYIHGDLSTFNILVQRAADASPTSHPTEDPDAYVISGVLDFQHASRSFLLYDLSILVAYAMMVAKTFDPLEVGGHIVAGYKTVLDLPELELSLLRVAVAGRMVQSLVLGAYAYSQDPSNTYVLSTAARGWHVLHALWDTPPEVLYGKWGSVQTS